MRPNVRAEINLFFRGAYRICTCVQQFCRLLAKPVHPRGDLKRSLVYFHKRS